MTWIILAVALLAIGLIILNFYKKIGRSYNPTPGKETVAEENKIDSPIDIDNNASTHENIATVQINSSPEKITEYDLPENPSKDQLLSFREQPTQNLENQSAPRPKIEVVDIDKL